MITNSIFGQVAVSVHEEGIHSHSGSGVVFSNFPLHEEDYATDIQEIMNETIERHGEQEWRLIVLTSELHGHLGIYAIIGAKMGLYAREILNAGQDELVLTSYAGSKPPVSCLNDGLQVSTGATLGHGLISVKETDTPLPIVEFVYQGKNLSISLKDTLQLEVARWIKEALISSGGINEAYWQKVRELGLSIWLGFDRNEIFDVTQRPH